MTTHRNLRGLQVQPAPLSKTLALVLFLALAVPALRAKKGSDADDAAIKQMIANDTAAFNRHDAAAVAMDYAEDADFTNMRGATRHGRMDIEAQLMPLFTTGPLKNATREITVRSIRFLTPTIAEVDMDSVVTGATSPNGQVQPPSKGLVDDILTKKNGRWMITVFHELDYPEAPGGARGR